MKKPRQPRKIKEIVCKKCKKRIFVKAGKNPTGKQKYKCVDCGSCSVSGDDRIKHIYKALTNEELKEREIEWDKKKEKIKRYLENRENYKKIKKKYDEEIKEMKMKKRGRKKKIRIRYPVYPDMPEGITRKDILRYIRDKNMQISIQNTQNHKTERYLNLQYN